MKFPIKFTKCPNCGSEWRIVEEEVAKEIEKGKMKPGAVVPAIVFQSHLIDPKAITIFTPRIEYPVLTARYDICTECGTVYLVEMVKNVGIAEPKINQN